VSEDDHDHVATEAWLLKLVGACDRALEQLSPDDLAVVVLRADLSDFRSTLHSRLDEHDDG
jgi:hypothetical protein